MGPDAESAARSLGVARQWLDGDARRRIADTFAGATGDDGAEAILDAAAALFADPDWLARLLAPLFAALGADPWFEPPLKISRDAVRSGAIVYEDARVTLSASILSAAAMRSQPPSATIVASGRVGLTRYLRGGGATLLRWRVPPLDAQPTAAEMGRAVPEPPLVLNDGALVRHDGRVGAQLTIDAGRDLAMITATARVGGDAVARAFDRATGAFLRMATTDEGAARAQLLLGWLRASGRRDAQDAFAAATRDRAFFLRWSAMRDWLAHDQAAARPRLEEMAADDPHPDVRAAALATLAALVRHAA